MKTKITAMNITDVELNEVDITISVIDDNDDEVAILKIRRMYDRTIRILGLDVTNSFSSIGEMSENLSIQLSSLSEWLQSTDGSEALGCVQLLAK